MDGWMDGWRNERREAERDLEVTNVLLLDIAELEEQAPVLLHHLHTHTLFDLHPQPSTLNLNPQQSTLNNPPSTLNPQP